MIEQIGKLTHRPVPVEYFSPSHQTGKKRVVYDGYSDIIVNEFSLKAVCVCNHAGQDQEKWWKGSALVHGDSGYIHVMVHGCVGEEKGSLVSRQWEGEAPAEPLTSP